MRSKSGRCAALPALAVSERRISTPGKEGEFSVVLDRLDVFEPERTRVPAPR
jgi:hypothetical protein